MVKYNDYRDEYKEETGKYTTSHREVSRLCKK